VSGWTSTTAREIATGLWRTARGIREKGEEAMPFAFLLAPDSMILPVLLDLSDKDAESARIRALAKRMRARFVALVCEGWTADGERALEWTKAGQSLRDLPGSTEILYLTLDGPGVCDMWMCQIVDGKLGETTHRENMPMTGRMVGLSGRLGEH
jgi:hypothetical protein